MNKDALRTIYFQADKSVTDMEFLRNCRRFAEAFCFEMKPLLADHLHEKYAKGDLNSQLGILRDNNPPLVPSVVQSALRVLQAYGNVASHHDPSLDSIPPEAIESTRASLALIAHHLWPLESSVEEEQGFSPKKKPGLFGRVELWLMTASPYFLGDERMLTQSDRDPESRLPRLTSAFNKISTFYESISKNIVARELEISTSSLTAEQAHEKLFWISKRCPSLVPAWIVEAFQKHKIRLLALQRLPVVSPQEKHDGVFEDCLSALKYHEWERVFAWYKYDYLGFSSNKDDLFRVAFFVALLVGLVRCDMQHKEEIAVAWRKQAAVIKKHCDSDDHKAICDDLRALK